MAALALVFIIHLLHLRFAGADIFIMPVEAMQEFSCTSPPEDSFHFTWAVNGSVESGQFENIVVGDDARLADGSLQSNLTFTAKSGANNTNIHCVVTHLSTEPSSFVSVDITVIFQGSLAPPGVAFNMSSDHAIHFFWSAPFTLNISNIEPDILYYTVYIVSDGAFRENVTTTETEYVLHPDPCHSNMYRVEIAAVNVVGEGEKYISPEIDIEGYAVVNVSRTETFFENGLPVIQLTCEVSPSCLQVAQYEVKLDLIYSSETILVNYTVGSGQQVLEIMAPNIEENELYNTTVGIKDLPASESTSIQLSTFTVQRAHMSKVACDIVNINCQFASGSQTKGCIIVVETERNTGNNECCEFAALREKADEARAVVVLPKEAHTLLVYDDKGRINHPAFNTTISILHQSECSTNSRSEHSEDSEHSEHSALTNTVAIAVSASTLCVAILLVFTFLLCLSLVLYFKKRKARATVTTSSNIAYEEVRLGHRRKSTISSAHNSYKATPF